jgi:hypothetical protein
VPAGTEATRRVWILGCGAIAGELKRLLGGLDGIDVTLDHLPGILHNRPEEIPPAIEKRLTEHASEFDRIILGYADCGTGGRLDALVERWDNVTRIPGAHCYEFFAGSAAFAELNDPFTFYLTDYLARHFDLFVWQGLGLDRWPHLRDEYFLHYRRLVYLSQQPTDDLIARSREAAERLGLVYEHIETGLGPLGDALGRLGLVGEPHVG